MFGNKDRGCRLLFKLLHFCWYRRYRHWRQRVQVMIKSMGCLWISSISTTKTEVSGRCSSYGMFGRYRQPRQRFKAVVPVMECLSISTRYRQPRRRFQAVQVMGCFTISIRYRWYRQQWQRFQAVVHVMGCLSISTRKTCLGIWNACRYRFDIDIQDKGFRPCGHNNIHTKGRVSISTKHRVLDIPRLFIWRKEERHNLARYINPCAGRPGTILLKYLSLL